MRQKKIFKRRQNRHPLRWMVVSIGLVSLTVVSFSAGVQFGQLEMQPSPTQYADVEAETATQVAHRTSR